ncbi:MAG: hypothetical protein OK442_03245 [Thaumarchaeota archaeon]|nr:hypothetical protein [Nitrososphaerota archaeon]
MVSSWMLSRFRSAWLSENLALLVLRLLKGSTLSEWEILSSLHSRYGLNPSTREFHRLEKTLVGEGYAHFDSGKRGNKLKITTAGLGALRRMEEEHQTVVSNAMQSGAG